MAHTLTDDRHREHGSQYTTHSCRCAPLASPHSPPARHSVLPSAAESMRAPRLALLASLALVHCITATSLGLSSEVMAQTKSQTPAPAKGSIPLRSQAALTPAAIEMRDAILEAVHSGRIEDLRHAIELNELKPDFGAAPGVDPIQHLKSLSRDGTGTEISRSSRCLLLESPRKSTPPARTLKTITSTFGPHFRPSTTCQN